MEKPADHAQFSPVLTVHKFYIVIHTYMEDFSCDQIVGVAQMVMHLNTNHDGPQCFSYLLESSAFNVRSPLAPLTLKRIRSSF